ncbi:MAG: 30S ribosomal protein THX [Flavobacteriales bacterium]|jgi:30S ribosomal protein S31|tara:strand:- start:91 stop:303 length:213 start_codon:yes stop_codon:yes gene_type:complete
MGRGDIKTKKGKRFSGSYGKVRVRKEEVEQFVAKPKTEKVEVKAAPKKKAVAKKTTAKKATTKKKVTKKD